MMNLGTFIFIVIISIIFAIFLYFDNKAWKKAIKEAKRITKL